MHAPLVAVKTDMPAPNYSGLLQMIEQNDEKHQSGHVRLRETIVELQEQHENLLASVGGLRDFAKENANRISSIEKTPPNVENIIMSPRVMVGIVTFALVIAGGVWASTSGLKSDVRDILTRMDAQKTAIDATSKLQEMQSTALRTAVDDMKRRQELQQYEIQGLKEMMLTGKVRSK